jgi:Zn-dependent M28 family amino/carboxypeptidase
MNTMTKLAVAVLALSAAQVDAKTIPDPPKPAGAGPSETACEARNNATVNLLLQCIRRDGLWRHMEAFWQIAQDNPGPDGHPSRNIGEPGYLASAQYVAEKMAAAGYSVQLQEYTVPYFTFTAMAYFDRVSPDATGFALRDNWNPATYSGSGNLTAPVQPVGNLLFPAPNSSGTNSGCTLADFAGFVAGNIALVERGTCSNYTKVRNAELSGAAGVIIFNDGSSGHVAAFRGSLSPFRPVGIPVAMSSYQIGHDFQIEYASAQVPRAHLDVQTIHDPNRPDYNVIADSPYGDPDRVVVVEGHLDAIYGAGMLDSASGSATILEVGLKLARTRTKNHLRYVWFGGEELGLYGSDYYVSSLSDEDAAKIVFDIDSDVTATPNYVTAIADPANSASAADWSPEMIAASQVGTNYFVEYFQARHLPYVVFSNDGTDSWNFAWRGVPNTGILTGQDCCKTQDLVDLFGGYLGNYEGNLDSFDGGFVDRPFLWGDNLDNNDPLVLEATSKAFAYVTWKLANDTTLVHGFGYPTVAAITAKKAVHSVPGKRSAVGEDR